MISDQVVSKKERKKIIKDLCSLASLNYIIIYLPEEEPAQRIYPIKNYNLAINK